MNLTIVAPFFPSGINPMPGIFLKRQVRAMAALGYNSTIIVPKRANESEYYNKIEYPTARVEIQRVNSFFVPKIRFPLPKPSHIVDIINQSKPDIIEFYNQDYLTALAFFKVADKGIPVVVTVNGIPGMSWQYGHLIVDLIGRVQTEIIGKRILRRAERIRTLSNQARKDCIRIGIEKERIETIHNGVTEKFSPPNSEYIFKDAMKILLLHQKRGKYFPAILYVGRLAPVKGIEYLLKAIKKIKHLNFKVYFVGRTDPLKKYNLPDDIKEKIEYLGYKKNVDEYMKACDVLVLPSISEGCPNVVLESMACGTPVVASDVGAVHDLIEDGVDGFVVESRNVEQLTFAIQVLIQNPEIRKMMRKQGIEKMKEFRWGKIAEKLDRFYRQAIKTSKGGK